MPRMIDLLWAPRRDGMPVRLASIVDQVCPTCHGSGGIVPNLRFPWVDVECPQCRGTGECPLTAEQVADELGDQEYDARAEL